MERCYFNSCMLNDNKYLSKYKKHFMNKEGKMTKIELVKIVSQKTGIDQPTVLAAVEGIVDTIKQALVEKENVYIRGWGTWTLKHRAQKTARNISKNTTLVIAAHDIPYFKPCKEFLEAVAAS